MQVAGWIWSAGHDFASPWWCDVMSVLIEVDSTKEGPNSSWNMDGILDERSDLSLILTDE